MQFKSYQTFKRKYLWSRVDTDWYPAGSKYQCVDLFKYYISFMYWRNILKSWNAKEIRTNKYKIFWKDRKQIKGTADLKQWDIIIRAVWSLWHIAIYDSRTPTLINVLEQNGVGWGNGRGWNAIRVHWYAPSFWTGIWRKIK